MGRQFFTNILFKRIASLLLAFIGMSMLARAQDSIHRGQGFVIADTVIQEPLPFDAPTVPIDEWEEKDAEREEQEVPEHFSTLTRAEVERERANFQLTSTADSVLKKWKNKDEFWYADKAFNVKSKPDSSKPIPFWNSPAFQTILLILAVVTFVALLIVFLGQNNGMLFRSSRQIVRSNAETEELPPNIFEIDFDREISRVEQQGNHRMAIRLRFLRLLRQLSDRNIIQYLEDRTNLDYLMQLQQSPWYNDFFRLMRHYEYSWYGLFDVNADQYARIRSDFEQINKKFY